MSLIKYPELYRAGIAIAAVSNWRQFVRDDRWQFNNKFAFTFWKSLLNRESFASDEKFIDPYLRAGEIKQPLYIIHGERDTEQNDADCCCVWGCSTCSNVITGLCFCSIICHPI